MDKPSAILSGLWRIILEPAILITDYVAIAGVGATLVNAGLLMLISTLILYFIRVQISGLSIASIFLMGSFALFGKNIFNVWLIVIGSLLYARIKKQPFREHVHVALLGTSMAPVVSEFFFVMNFPLWEKIVLGVITGISIGFFLPALSAHLIGVHKGFNLYNVGFAAGILGTIYVSVFKSYGYVVTTKLIWSTGNNFILGIFLSGLFLLLLVFGLTLSHKTLGEIRTIFFHIGKPNADFLEVCNFGVVLINMTFNGILATGYVLLVGGPLNGPTVGGILTVVGFGAFGKHAKNIIPIFVGVVLGGLTKTWGVADPLILLAALFGTSLAPISGHYGWIWGIVAGFINSSVVLNSGILHGGMNLYNTGFSAGLVAAVLVPLLNAFSKRKVKAEPSFEKRDVPL